MPTGARERTIARPAGSSLVTGSSNHATSNAAAACANAQARFGVKAPLASMNSAASPMACFAIAIRAGSRSGSLPIFILTARQPSRSTHPASCALSCRSSYEVKPPLP